MKIFVQSDPHGQMKLLQKTLNEVKNGNYDVFLGLGDFINQRYFAQLVTNLDVDKKAFIMGNWDHGLKGTPYLKDFEKFDYDGTRFVLMGSVDFGNLKKKILDACGDVDGKNLIIGTHEPPHRARDEIHSGQRVGVPEFREIIEEKQPLLWLCGHIHEAEGVSMLGDTKVINASAYKGSIGYSVEVEDGEIKNVKKVE
ncbi:MAG: metallophosphoesterase [Candidatus Aenigmatarchaeota archaeon]